MLSVLNSILTTIISVVMFVVHSIESLISLLVRIPTLIGIMVTSVGFMPSIIMPIALVTISISVVLFVVGRQS